MVVENNTILNKLDSIKTELDYIKEHMVEKDEIMVCEDFVAYQKSFDKKNLVSFEDAKKQLK